MPDTSKLEKLNRELEKSEKKLRKAINDEKALQHQLCVRALSISRFECSICGSARRSESLCRSRA